MERAQSKVCVTGGSGFIASWLIKKLLEKGYTVHATLRNLGDESKVGLLKSLPFADINLVLFQADVWNPLDFEAAISGCDYVFHLAHPMPSSSLQLQQQDTMVNAIIVGVRSIADSCIRLGSVKRLIYTASLTSLSPFNEDRIGYKSCIDESCWTPLNITVSNSNATTMVYAKSKTLADKELLTYNEIENSKLEVVVLNCGQVAGETLLPYVPLSTLVVLSPLKGDVSLYLGLKFMQELLGSIPLVHVDDACEAHLFCMEKQSIKGRFLCVESNPTIREIAMCFQEIYPELRIAQEFMGDEQEAIGCDNSKLINMGFQYKYNLRMTLEDSVECGKRLGYLTISE